MAEKKGISLKEFLIQHKELLLSKEALAGATSLKITPETVFGPATPSSQAISHKFVDGLMSRESTIVGIEHLEELGQLTDKKESCLILLEHYSNADYPCFHKLLVRLGHQDLADKLVAMAGLKLYEDSPFLNILVKSFTSLFIYPSRAIEKLTTNDVEEKERSSKINMAAIRSLMEIKKSGHIVALFPAGTRYRSWAPESKAVVREIASYLKQFDNCVFVGINGNVLRVTNENMEEDLVTEDTMIFNVSPVIKTKEFIEQMTAGKKDSEDSKDLICRAVEVKLEEMHQKGIALYYEKTDR